MSTEETENRETWLVRLHLSNDHEVYLHTTALAEEAYAAWSPHRYLADFYGDTAEGEARRERARIAYAGDALEDYVREELIPELGGTAGELLAGDLIGHALQDVDWTDIADGCLPEDPAERRALLDEDGEGDEGLRPATPDEEAAYHAGHVAIPGAVETEDGLMVPEEESDDE